MVKKALYGKIFSKRMWLNPSSSSTACAGAYINLDNSPKEVYKYMDAGIELKDCSRSISLDFSEKPKDIHRSLKKIDKLIKFFTEFREKMVIAQGEFKKVSPKKREKVGRG